MPSKFQTIVAAVIVGENAIIGVLTDFNVGHWTAAQGTVVATAVTAATSFVAAVVAHLAPNTAKEPVALAATFTALVAAVLALGTGFGWWHLTDKQTAALVSAITAFIGIGSALIARQQVSPVKQPGT